MPSDKLRVRQDVQLSTLTTMRVGGRARWYSEATSADALKDAIRWAADHGSAIMPLGGGSNIVVSDEGVDALVIRIDIRGRKVRHEADALHVLAGAGESWDALVEDVVATGFAGMECLSGIPGTVGGTPIQNVGAYGQEVAQIIDAVDAIDRSSSESVTLTAAECDFQYRHSRFRNGDRDRYLITGVSFRLTDRAPTLTYPDVRASFRGRGENPPSPAEVRRAVLDIRRAKGMVLDENDIDTRSVGSFFMNPVVPAATHASIETAVRGDVRGFPTSDGRMKIPAAWLIQQAGFGKGYVSGRVGLSSKHPLAIVNRGGATAREIVELAASIKRRVGEAFGIWLMPEPRFVGFDDDETVGFLRSTNY